MTRKIPKMVMWRVRTDAHQISDAELKRQLIERARAAGFDDVRVAAADLEPGHGARVRAWLDAGMHGEMSYMERTAERRASAATVLEGARSVLVFSAPYHPGPPPEQQDGALQIAKYALGEDYHWILKQRLAGMIEWLETVRLGHAWRACTDSAPLLERAYAVASGIGFFGKNSLVITPGLGSFFLLAEIVTTAPIEPDLPVTGTCGTCTRCIDACPTDAILPSGTIDARRCLSYLTIEKKSPLTLEESAAVAQSGWLFGCDICQDVCPYNKSPSPARISEFSEGQVVQRGESAETFLAPASNGQFERRFAKSPILRPGRRRVQANARAIQNCSGETTEADEGSGA